MTKYFLIFIFFFSSCFGVVSTFLNGQLGNQMFQIAAALALAEDVNTDATFPQLRTQSKFNMKQNGQIFFYNVKSKGVRSAVSRYKEPSHRYTPLPLKNNVRLFGYFQSEMYFKHQQDLIKRTFAPQEKIVLDLKRRYSQIFTFQNSVAIHLRTYVKDDPGNKNYYLCSREYFEKAVALFPKDSEFYVFSDDMDIAKAHLAGIAENLTFIEGESYWNDFWLMAFCKHQIISNSTFSWWAAWLNENPDKVVVAPKDWFACNDDTDIVPEEWVVLDNLDQ